MDTDSPEDDYPKVSDQDKEAVERQLGDLRDFTKTLSGDDLKSGNWFTKLLQHSLKAYTEKVDADYFKRQYPGLPADAVVEARIRMAARYAAIEGGLSAGAYSVAIITTLGSVGGASPLTVPAAVTTLIVDVLYTTQLQLKLAYDIATLYRVPLDLEDPGDLWKLIRIAFTIKSGEAVREGVTKGVPILVRPLIRLFYKGQVLSAARGLPIVGKYLLQRTVIKVGIPLVGVPLATVLNRYSTLIAGRHARAMFRNEARIIEIAQRTATATAAPRALLWVTWATAMADRKISDDEILLLRHLVAGVKHHHGVSDQRFMELIDINRSEVWDVVRSDGDAAKELRGVAEQVASFDGPVNKSEQAFLDAMTAEFDLAAAAGLPPE